MKLINRKTTQQNAQTMPQQAHTIINIDKVNSFNTGKNDTSASPKIKRRRIIALLIILAIILPVVFAIANSYKEEKFITAFKKAATVAHTGDLREAEMFYSDAAELARNENDYAMSKYFGATCLYIYYLETQSDDRFPYLIIAIDTYTDIVTSEKYNGSEYYYECIAGLIEIYNSKKGMLGIDVNKLVNLLEEHSKELNSESVYSALFEYYADKVDSYENTKDNYDNSLKAIYYNAKMLEILRHDKDLSIFIDTNGYLYKYIQLLEKSINFSYTFDNDCDNLDSIILCINAIIDNYSDYNSNQFNFVGYKYILGKAYLFRSMKTGDKDIRDVDRWLSRDCFLSLLKMGLDYHTYGKTLINSVHFLSMTFTCVNEDLEPMANAIQSYLDYYEYTDFNDELQDKSELCSSCKKIIQIYGYNESIYNYGKYLVDYLKPYKDLLNSISPLTDDLDTLKAFFEQDLDVVKSKYPTWFLDG